MVGIAMHEGDLWKYLAIGFKRPYCPTFPLTLRFGLRFCRFQDTPAPTEGNGSVRRYGRRNAALTCSGKSRGRI